MTIACPDCGTLQELPLLPPRSRGVCPICRKHLELTRGRSVTAALGCALATFLFLFPANFAPLMSVSLLGTSRSSLLVSGVFSLWNEHWFLLSVLICAFTVVLPFVRFGLLSLVLGMIRVGRRRHWLGRVFRWAIWLDTWAMPDVLLVALFVGYQRLKVNLDVHFGWGGYCFIVAALLSMLSRASLDRRTVWRAIEEDHPLPEGVPALSCTTCAMVMPLEAEGTACPRCGARLLTRKLNALPRATALNLAAFILYWLANIYPMNISIQLGHRVNYRIIDGIRALFEAGLAPLGILVFCTSIAIPLMKILGLGWCLWSIARGSRKHLVAKTELYRAVDELGRWSNVDPFIVAVFVPLMQFGALASSRAASGASAFIAVVVLTLLASHAFDPRLMWDVAEDRNE